MAAGAGLATRLSLIKEDANFAAFYLSCLALGVILVSKNGSNIDLLNLLFGSVLAVDKPSLALIAVVASVTLTTLMLIYRPLLIESVDSTFLRIVKGRGGVWHIVFLMLVVINLVAGFQTLGTLMSVGLMMLPAICSRMWFSRMETLLIGSVLIAVLASIAGLLLSFYIDIPSGPAVILICGVIYFFSLLFATNGILMPYMKHKRHRKLSK